MRTIPMAPEADWKRAFSGPDAPLAWIVSCSIAEGIGMTASAIAARAAPSWSSSMGLVIVVIGGLVEGLALGILQASWLARRYPGLSRARWVVTTVLVAGVGWAFASAPAALGDGSGSQPPPALILAASAGLGVAMGALMGAAQALAFRGAVRHPWRWVWISTIAWMPTMVVIFVGATLPDASWPTGRVVVLAAITGLAAGAALGVVSLSLMGTLNGPSIISRLLSFGLRHRLLGVGDFVALLRISGVDNAHALDVPVQYARDGDVVVVCTRSASRTRWWRNLRRSTQLSVWLDGGWTVGVAQVLAPSDPAFPDCRRLYSARYPHVLPGHDAALVRIVLGDRL